MWERWSNRNISELVGKTISGITADDFEIIFTCDNGDKYKLYHEQDCCESVTIDDINGDLNNLVGAELLIAEEVTNANMDNPKDDGYWDESYTWTFYKFGTIKGYVDIKWYGESNGYYSESVDFSKYINAKTK